MGEAPSVQGFRLSLPSILPGAQINEGCKPERPLSLLQSPKFILHPPAASQPYSELPQHEDRRLKAEFTEMSPGPQAVLSQIPPSRSGSAHSVRSSCLQRTSSLLSTVLSTWHSLSSS